MSRKIIGVLEDNPERVAAMAAWLDDRFGMYEHLITADPRRLLDLVHRRADDVLIVSLDHDLFEAVDAGDDPTGMQVVDELVARPPAFPVIVHSSNAQAARTMVQRLKRRHWTVVSVMPIEDTAWIGREWYYELRRLIHDRAAPDAQLAPVLDDEA